MNLTDYQATEFAAYRFIPTLEFNCGHGYDFRNPLSGVNRFEIYVICLLVGKLGGLTEVLNVGE